MPIKDGSVATSARSKLGHMPRTAIIEPPSGTSRRYKPTENALPSVGLSLFLYLQLSPPKKGPYNYGPIPLIQHSLCCGSFILHCLKKTSLKKLRNYLVEALPYTLYICPDLGLIPFLCAFLTGFDAYKGVTLSVDKGTDNWLVRGTGIARRTMYSYTPNRRVFLGLFHYSLSLQSGYLQYPLSCSSRRILFSHISTQILAFFFWFIYTQRVIFVSFQL